METGEGPRCRLSAAAPRHSPLVQAGLRQQPGSRCPALRPCLPTGQRPEEGAGRLGRTLRWARLGSPAARRRAPATGTRSLARPPARRASSRRRRRGGGLLRHNAAALRGPGARGALPRDRRRGEGPPHPTPPHPRRGERPPRIAGGRGAGACCRPAAGGQRPARVLRTCEAMPAASAAPAPPWQLLRAGHRAALTIPESTEFSLLTSV